MSDIHDALNELAQRGVPRGFDHVLAGAADTAAAELVERGGRGDDLETVPFVMPEPMRRRRRPLGSAIAAAGVAALLLVGAFAVSAVVGSGGAGSPESAVRQLADAVSHEDPLAAADVLAPDEVRSLHQTLGQAENKAAELQLVQTAGAPLAGIDFDVSGLKLSTESLGDGYAKVTVDTGTFSASTHKAQFSALMQKVLRNSGDNNSVSDDLTQLFANDNLPTFVVTVRQDGHWYVSAAYTILEYIRENEQLPAADFGSGARSISTLGADSPDAAVQQSMRAIQHRDWSTLLTMAPPSEIPVYDYRAALLELAHRNNSTDTSAHGFTIDAMTTAAQISGDTAKVTLNANGTADSGAWSIDGGCLQLSDSTSIACDPLLPLVGLLGTTSGGLDKSSQVTAVKQGGRWFVSPVGTVLDVLDSYISNIDRRALFTFLNIPSQLPPDGRLMLGRPVVMPHGTTLLGLQVLSFDGHKGESLLGHVTSPAQYPSAFVRVFAPDGSEIDNGSALLDGQPLVLPADGKYTFVFQSYELTRSSEVTVTIWDSADAPAVAKQNPFGGTNGASCTYDAGGGETCSSQSFPGGPTPTVATGVTVVAGGTNGGASFGFGSGSSKISSATSIAIAPPVTVTTAAGG